ncbi:hypothetical protein THAOC_00128, partial [Thalassiosira oceanica]
MLTPANPATTTTTTRRRRTNKCGPEVSTFPDAGPEVSTFPDAGPEVSTFPDAGPENITAAEITSMLNLAKYEPDDYSFLKGYALEWAFSLFVYYPMFETILFSWAL